jgi:hypothetical protein
MHVYSSTAPAHTFDHDRIACPCGRTVGYRLARSKEPLRCVACGRVYEPAPAAPPKLAPAVQTFVDAWDNARARALTGDSSVAIPITLVDALDDARKALGVL